MLFPSNLGFSLWQLVNPCIQNGWYFYTRSNSKKHSEKCIRFTLTIPSPSEGHPNFGMCRTGAPLNFTLETSNLYPGSVSLNTLQCRKNSSFKKFFCLNNRHTSKILVFVDLRNVITQPIFVLFSFFWWPSERYWCEVRAQEANFCNMTHPKPQWSI